jgi:hypothetical protein
MWDLPIHIEDDDEPRVVDGKRGKVNKGKECLEYQVDFNNPSFGF